MFVLQNPLGIDPETYVDPTVDALVTVLVFAVSFGLLYLLGRYFVARALGRLLQQQDVDETLVSLATSSLSVVSTVVALALAATIAGFGVVLAAFATLGGAFAVAVGFASKDIIANLVAGVFILHDEPFDVGDWIEWNDHSAVVENVTLRVTKLNTFDDQQITVPNSDLANSPVINNMENDTRRVEASFGIGYDSDIDRAREIILTEGADIEGVFEEPEPAAPVTELGDSAVVFSGRIYVDPHQTSVGGVRAQFLERVKRRFDAEGIDMPYPNTELSGGIEVETSGEGTAPGA
jgi:small-conductance mechanosensitive channel